MLGPRDSFHKKGLRLFRRKYETSAIICVSLKSAILRPTNVKLKFYVHSYLGGSLDVNIIKAYVLGTGACNYHRYDSKRLVVQLVNHWIYFLRYKHIWFLFLFFLRISNEILLRVISKVMYKFNFNSKKRSRPIYVFIEIKGNFCSSLF